MISSELIMLLLPTEKSPSFELKLSSTRKTENPNMFDFDHNRARGGVVIGWVLTSIGLVVVSLRLYTRAVLTHSIGSDDFFIVIPAVSVPFAFRTSYIHNDTDIRQLLQIYECISDTFDMQNGFGQHDWTLSKENIAESTKW